MLFSNNATFTGLNIHIQRRKKRNKIVLYENGLASTSLRNRKRPRLICENIFASKHARKKCRPRVCDDCFDIHK